MRLALGFMPLGPLRLLELEYRHCGRCHRANSLYLSCAFGFEHHVVFSSSSHARSKLWIQERLSRHTAAFQYPESRFGLIQGLSLGVLHGRNVLWNGTSSY
jgi:hypothetical protein